MKRFKKIIIVVSLLLAAALTGFLIMMVLSESKLEKVRSMQIQNVDLTTLEDGTYQGEYAYGNYTYRVEVTIRNHKIEDIMVNHGRDSKHAKNAEGVIDKIITEQRTDVDVVSGATTTSKAILKAVEIALTQ